MTDLPINDPTVDIEGIGDIRLKGTRDVPIIETPKVPDALLLPSREDRKFALGIAVQMTLVGDGVDVLIAKADTVLDYIVRGTPQSV